MKFKYILAAFVLSITYSNAQIRDDGSLSGLYYAKEFSKEIAEYDAKTFMLNSIFGHVNQILEFQVEALAAATSGQLTTLVYRCDSLKKSGLILGFYGTRWNDAGVVYSAYQFKDLPIAEANQFLDTIALIIKREENFIQPIDNKLGTNNVCFYFHDIRILLYSTLTTIRLRLYWNGFDSEWEYGAFLKTQNRLAKFLKPNDK